MKHLLTQAVVLAGLSLSGLSAAADDPGYEKPYTQLLQTYVNDEGLVDYTALKSNRGLLDRIVSQIEKISEAEYDSWDENGKIAYLINAYNALTLQVIVDHYPIQSNWKARILGHPIGIRHIPGVWDEFTWTVAGKELSLNNIEHDVLRKEFNRPAIHMGLVCASISCPKLRREAYTANSLDDQLRAQTQAFLSQPENFLVEKHVPRVGLSSIFKWFKEDFTRKYGVPEKFAHHGDHVAGIFSFIIDHIQNPPVEILASRRLDVDYLEYDWSLNDLKN